MKILYDKQKSKEYMQYTKPAIQKILKEILHTEDENKHSHKRMGATKCQEKQ
jgi:hypothetical protein